MEKSMLGASGHSLRYFGSWDNDLVQRDFTETQLRDFTIRKEIMFESKDKNEVSKQEGELILSLRSSDPSIGYNKTDRPRLNLNQ